MQIDLDWIEISYVICISKRMIIKYILFFQKICFSLVSGYFEYILKFTMIFGILNHNIIIHIYNIMKITVFQRSKLGMTKWIARPALNPPKKGIGKSPK